MKYQLLLIVSLSAFLMGCDTQPKSDGPAPDAPTATESFNAFMDSVFDAAVSRSPEWETELGIRTHYGEWSDLSDAHEAEELRIRKNELAVMKARFDPATLDRTAKLSFRLFEEMVRNKEARHEWHLYHYPVNQMHGLHAETVSFLINAHRVDSVPDAKAYVSRLEKMDQRMDQIVELLRKRAEAGIIPPKFVFPKVLSDCRNVISGVPFDGMNGKKSTLWEDFEKKVAALELEEGLMAELMESGKRALIDHVKPGYGRLIAELEAMEKQADDRDGAWKFPRGDEYYRHALKMTTTTDMGPEEIHAVGLAEVDRIHGEMREIMKTVGYEGTLNEFFDFMRNDQQFYYPNTEEGRAAYLARATAVIDSMRERLPSIFGTLPRADIVVKRVEAYREKSAGKAFYDTGAPDGTRPGTYYANLYDMADMPTYQMEALAYHEGIPGHHMQLSIAMEQDAIPMFRRHMHYTAYIEGWALYSEWVPTTLGFYQDPYADFGRLAMELWRACRLVVDTGIHWKKWTRQEAIDYLNKNTPNPEGDVIKAIERYIVMPSQATAYKIGMLRIMELREKAEAAMGDRFDVRQFHDVILTNGAVPLNVLEELVEEWMAS